MSCCKGVKKSAKKVMQIATGYAYLSLGVNEELSRKRMRICNNCPFFVGGVSCKICGCTMVAKTRIPAESCPDTPQRWKAAA